MILDDYDFTIKQNDRLPALQATLEDGEGNPVDLTGTTIKFKMRGASATTLKVDAGATIVSPTLGTVKYEWAAAETDTPGDYYGEFEVTSAGKTLTFPNGAHLFIRVLDDL